MGQIGFQALEIGEQGQVWLSTTSEGCCFNLYVNCDQVIKPESGWGGAGRKQQCGGESTVPRRPNPSADPRAPERGQERAAAPAHTAVSAALPPGSGQGEAGARGAPGLPVSAPAPACSSLTSGRPSPPGRPRTTCRRSSRTRRAAAPPGLPGVPSSRSRDCMGPGCRRRRFGAPGEPRPERQLGPARQGDRKLTAPSPPETPSPGAAGSPGSGPGRGGGEVAGPPGGTAEPRGEPGPGRPPWAAGPRLPRLASPSPVAWLHRGPPPPRDAPRCPATPWRPECRGCGGLGPVTVGLFTGSY